MRTHFHKLARTGDERGAALVEFALIFPLFMMLALGMFTGGAAYNKKLEVTSATREGARYAATLDKSSANWDSQVRAVVVQRGAGRIDPSDVCVALVQGTGPATTVVLPSGGSQCPLAEDMGADSSLRIQVSARTTSEFEALVYSRTLTLTAGAVSRYEGS